MSSDQQPSVPEPPPGRIPPVQPVYETIKKSQEPGSVQERQR